MNATPGRMDLNDALQLQTPLGDHVLQVKKVVYEAQMSRPYSIGLQLESGFADLDADSIIGQPMTVLVDALGDVPKFLNGYVSEFAQIATDGVIARYEAVLVPWLWFLTQRSDCRIFQDMTVPDIVCQVFDELGFARYRINLMETYRSWEYCVQYNETAFNFVLRLLEQEGIAFSFTHDAGEHEMVLYDNTDSRDPIDGDPDVPFALEIESENSGEHVSVWRRERTVRSGAYAHDDYDFVSPRKDLLARTVSAESRNGELHEIYQYPGEYHTVTDGERCARTELQRIEVGLDTIRGTASCIRFRPGRTFTLINHPHESEQGRYLLTSVTWSMEARQFGSGAGDSKLDSTCDFTAIPASRPYRPPLTAIRPSIQGPQTAIVVGRADEEIWTDAYGRVKVQFQWDRYGRSDENSSCWIRVAQAAAGTEWGAVFLPRIGQEVIVEFLGGDPDRPIITGRVYNGLSMPPYELPANSNLSGIKTNSTKSGGGFNELRFDDCKDAEQLFLHAQRNYDLRIKNDCFETVEHNRHLVVKAREARHVYGETHDRLDGDHHESLGKSRYTVVKEDVCIDIGGDAAMQIGANFDENIKANRTEEVAGNRTIKAGNIHLEALGHIAFKVGGSSVVIDALGVTITAPMVTIDGGITRVNSGPGTPPVLAPSSPAFELTDEAVRAHEADSAVPGGSTNAGGGGDQPGDGPSDDPMKPHVPPVDDDDLKKLVWIEIELVDRDGEPVPYESYEIVLPCGETKASGRLDRSGFARVEGIEPGMCEIRFPNLHCETWQRV